MRREWQPGDVAIATVRGTPNVQIVRTASRRALWFSAESDGPYPDGVNSIRWHAEGDIVDARPLVVIDPDDHEQVYRLTNALVDAAHKHGNTVVSSNGIHGDTTRAALREFANPPPPKPDEPTGLGAVVEDVDGQLWVRVDEREAGWCAANVAGPFGCWNDFSRAVKVLSEGIQP